MILKIIPALLDRIHASLNRNDAAVGLQSLQFFLRIPEPGANLIRLLRDKVERTHRTVHLKVLLVVAIHQVTQYLTSQLGILVLVAYLDDIAVVRRERAQTAIDLASRHLHRHRLVGILDDALRPHNRGHILGEV